MKEIGFTWKVTWLSGLLVPIALLGAGCNENPPDSIYDPNAPLGLTPTISAISPSPGSPPPNTPLAGVTTITIAGTNFSTVGANNVVYFDRVIAQVLDATNTQLRVRAPNLPKDSIQVKVSVIGGNAEKFSDVSMYELDIAVEEYAGLDTLKRPAGITCDANGNLFVSVYTSTGLTISRISNNTLDSALYSPVLASSSRSYNSLKFGPGGDLYATAKTNIIFRIPPGGGASTLWLRGGLLGNTVDLDFDQSGTMWAGGGGTAVYRIRLSDKNVKQFPFTATVRSVRVFGNDLYVAARMDTTEGIWRFPIISADSLGTPQLAYNFGAAFPGFGAYALTFTVDGDMLIGTDAPAGLVIVRTGGGTGEPFYSGLLGPKVVSMAYSNDVNLFVTQEFPSASGRTERINTQKLSAPYYGR